MPWPNVPRDPWWPCLLCCIMSLVEWVLGSAHTGFVILNKKQKEKKVLFPRWNYWKDREGRSGTTGDFRTSFLHFSLFSTAPWGMANSRFVLSFMLSSHLFLCLPCLLPLFTVPFKMIWARPDERETWPYHLSLCFFYNGQKVFEWFDCLMDLGKDSIVGDMVFLWNA